MSLTPGTRLGPYEVIAKIGEGGMGEVYRATDTRLNRDAALKVLPESLTADPDRRARFTREAQVLASLSHPNIAGIYGFEDASGVPVLAMEFVEGEDLSAVIARGAIPLADALPLARQIAEALEAAHDQGIVHRDLKPQNIKVKADGTVKVLDFGLAKAMETGVGNRESGVDNTLANSPTITTPAMTMRGMILGTAAYMSPEQAKGKPVDKRADIWAFGALLFEMLTGRRAFHGEGVSETLAAVIKDAPDLTLLPTTTPLRIRALVERCLERDVKRRLRDIGEARITLTGSVEPDPQARPVPPGRRASAGWMAAGVAVLVAGALAVPAWRYVTAVTDPVPPAQFEISAPDGSNLQPHVSVSPDGLSVVFVQGSSGAFRMWRRRLDSTDTTELVASQGGLHPFWSPDSTQVAFFVGDQLKIVDTASGSARMVCEGATFEQGGSWSRDGTILFGGPAGLLRVPAAGGTPEPVTMDDGADPAAVRMRPYFLPDGRHFLYAVRASNAEATKLDIHIGDLQSGRGTPLLTADSHAVAAPGFVLFARAGILFAQPFDADSLELSGTAHPVHPVMPRGQPFGISQNGVLALRPADSGRPPSDLVWIDRRGSEIGKLKKPPTGDYAHPAISPDGQLVAVNSFDPVTGRNQIWIIDTARDVAERFIVGDGWSADPVWSPDGRRLAFVTERNGRLQIVSKALDGSSEDVLEDLGPGRASDVLAVTTTDWSPDGKFIVYSISTGVGAASDGLRVLSVADRTSSPLGVTAVMAYAAKFSRDGRWIAYSARDSGRNEVYIAAFPELNRRRQISNEGGIHPRWGKDDRELFYLRLNSAGIGVVPLTESGTDLRPGVPRLAYDRDPRSLLDGRNHYTATADGDRLLVRQPLGGAALSTVRVLVNWPAMLQK